MFLTEDEKKIMISVLVTLIYNNFADLKYKLIDANQILSPININYFYMVLLI